MQSVEETPSTIPKAILYKHEFNPHPHVVKLDQLNSYHHISAPADDTSAVTNDENIPTIITDILNNAWEHYKQYNKEYNMHCDDYHCYSHGYSHQNGSPYFPTTRCSLCGTYGYGCLDWTLAETVYQKAKEI